MADIQPSTINTNFVPIDQGVKKKDNDIKVSTRGKITAAPKSDNVNYLPLETVQEILQNQLVGDELIEAMKVGKLLAGEILSQSIVMGVLKGKGDVEIRSGIDAGVR